MTRKDIVLRSVIFFGLAGLSLLFLAMAFKRPALYGHSGKSYPHLGVTLLWEQDAVFVRLDDKEELVPRSELGTSSIYQKAIARIPKDALPAETEIRWRRVLRLWLPFTIITWFALFRLWQPLRPYVEGQRV